MKLREIAHARTGDKGNMCNIAIIPYEEKYYEILKSKSEAKKCKQ